MEIRILATGSDGNCYHVQSGKNQILIECGIPIAKIRKSLDYKLSEIDACLISHEHSDHSKSFADLQRFGIPIYASNGTLGALYCFGIPMYENLYNIGNLKIKTFPLVHDAAEHVGFLITDGYDKLLYISDTCRIDQRFIGVTHLMIEVNYDSISDDCEYRDRLINNHMSLDTALSFISTLDLETLQKIFIIHPSEKNLDLEKAVQKIRELTGKEVKGGRK